MKILSWNVNSIRVRKNQLLSLIKKENPDIVCLQEIKSSNDAFPIKDFENLNYFLRKWNALLQRWNIIKV